MILRINNFSNYSWSPQLFEEKILVLIVILVNQKLFSCLQ